MLTTKKLVEMVRETTKTGSYYAASNALGITQQAVTGYMRSGRVMNDEIGVKAASLLGLPEAYVLACLNVERGGKPETVRVWRALAIQLEPPHLRDSA